MKRNDTREIRNSFFVHKRNVSAVKRVEFDRDNDFTGRWYHTIVLNVHAPADDNINHVKESFYKELDRVFDKFPT
jgi:hypothetical protein